MNPTVVVPFLFSKSLRESVGRAGPVFWLVAGLLLSSCTGTAARRGQSRPGGPRCPLHPVGPTFGLFDRGQLATLFARDRGAMVSFLFNADGLWPKTVDLCARGRNALLDLEVGPGASYELGLWGPSWDAPIYSVAVTNPFIRGRVTGSHFLATWPLVADGRTEWLRQAAELAFLARSLERSWVSSSLGSPHAPPGAGRPAVSRALDGVRRPGGGRAVAAARAGPKSKPWARLDLLARATHLGRFRFFLCRMPLALLSFSRLANLGRAFRRAGHCRGGPGVRRWDGIALKVAAQWGRRLTGALAHSLLRRPTARKAAGLAKKESAERQARFIERLLAGDHAAYRLVRDWTEKTENLARNAGVLFESRRYRRFRRDHLTVCLPGQGCGLGLDAVEAIVNSALKRGKAELARRAQREADRLRFVMFGQAGALSEEQRHVLAAERRAYEAIEARIESDRRRLALLARDWFARVGSRILSSRLRRVGDLLLSSSFYFQTEHLEQTRSGFTHAALLEKLGPVAGIGSAIWQLDRVLGYFYVYPLSRLAHSVTVELLEPAPSILRRPRRYQWVEMTVPTRFHFRSGAVSGKVTLSNLFAHLVAQLRSCQGFYSLPGFFYAAASWMAMEPRNARLFAGAWQERTHRGGRYRTLSRRWLDGLKGKTILLPVGLVPGAGRRDDHRPR